MDDTEVINFLLSTEIIPLCLRTMETGSELSKTVATFIVQKILLDNVRPAWDWRGGQAGGQRAGLRCPPCAGGGSAASRAGTLAQPAPTPTHVPHLQVGLSYICATAERFFAVGAVLSSMVTGLAEQPSVRLLKHIIRCYLRLRWAAGGVGWGACAVMLTTGTATPPPASTAATPPPRLVWCSDNPRAREALRQCLPDLLRNPQFTACLKDDVTTRRWLAQLLVNVGHLQDAAALGTDVVGPTPPV